MTDIDVKHDREALKKFIVSEMKSAILKAIELLLILWGYLKQQLLAF